MIDSMNEQSKEGEKPSKNISNPLRASARKKGVNMTVITIEKFQQGGLAL